MGAGTVGHPPGWPDARADPRTKAPDGGTVAVPAGTEASSSAGGSPPVAVQGVDQWLSAGFPVEDKIRIVLSVLAGEVTMAEAARRADLPRVFRTLTCCV